MFNKNTINRFQKLETPFYYYDLDVLRKTLEACRTASSKYGFHVHYAMKSNFNTKVLDAIQSYGFGADCAGITLLLLLEEARGQGAEVKVGNNREYAVY